MTRGLRDRVARTAADTLGLETATLEIPASRGHRVGCFVTLKSPAEALYVYSDPLLLASAPLIDTLALAARLPTMHALRSSSKREV